MNQQRLIEELLEANRALREENKRLKQSYTITFGNPEDQQSITFYSGDKALKKERIPQDILEEMFQEYE
jgi:regulator of replication initiation timing